MIQIAHGDNLDILINMSSDSVDLIYTDPPFGTGNTQVKTTLNAKRNLSGERIGFGGNGYDLVQLAKMQYSDNIQNYHEFLFPRLVEMWRILKPTGSLFLHLDWREVHYVKIFLDSLFGADNFRNELIWAFDYGAKSKSYWPRKHQTILFYSKSEDYYFDIEQSDRLPYMAPELAGAEKAARGKLPTDVWWQSIVGTNSKEKTNYPSQKPENLLKRIVVTASKEGDLLVDPFAGSGTLGMVAYKLHRDCMLIDSNIEAIEVMKQRFKVVDFMANNTLVKDYNEK